MTRQRRNAIVCRVCVVLMSCLAVTATTSGQAVVETTTVGVGRSVVIDTPWPSARVSLTDPAIANVQVLTPRQVLLTGKTLGITDLIAWSEDGQVWQTAVSVVVDLTYLREELRLIFPHSELDVAQSQDLLIVSGKLRRTSQVDQLHQVLDALEVKYIDTTTVAGVHQVMLTVRIAEASRTAIRSLGVNFFSGGDRFFGQSAVGADGGGGLNRIPIGPVTGSPVDDIAFAVGEGGLGGSISLLLGFPNSDLQFFIDALAENQYVRILAEPTLIALSGEDANFLAGGEFPVPVVQGGGAGGQTSITIEYKEFGVHLAFRPVVLGDGTIRLRVAPEVSELSDFGAVVIEGFQIPSVLTRRAETTLELKNGQSFAMAGLLSESTEARRSSIPLLGDLPVIGPLFRSMRYVNGETELVVLVTADLVEPSSESGRGLLPGDLHVRPSDWEFFLGGTTEGAPPVLAAADMEYLRSMGLNRLHGPGAWTTHYDRPVPVPFRRVEPEASPGAIAAPNDDDFTRTLAELGLTTGRGGR